MVVAENVEVYLARHSDGACYTEYAPPFTSPSSNGAANEVYVEAVANERFTIHVKLLPAFKFLKHPKVRVRYLLDKGGSLRRDHSRRKHPHAQQGSQSHREAEVSFRKCFLDGQWMICGLTFGELAPGMCKLRHYRGVHPITPIQMKT